MAELALSSVVQLLISGLSVGAIYSAMALGLTTIYGILRLLHIAHAGVYVAGAYFGFMLYILTGNIVLSFGASALSSMALGYAIERALYLPLIKKPKHILLAISIAMFMLIEELVANVAGHYPKGFYTNIPNVIINLGEVVLTTYQILVVGLAYIASLIVWGIYSKTKIGMASRALIQDMEIAECMGVNSKRVIDFNFLVGSALAGISGILVGIYYSSIWPYMGDPVAYKALVVIVLGGFGSIPGVILGGLILGVTESYLVALLGRLLPKDAFAFIVLILLLVFRPRGLFGKIE
ncbi:MAG: branched-chain amino acid ABC transporter permease [Desulfurococcaceae archaeon]